MWAWRCEEALLRAPRIPELWCEMRREKAYGRGCSATNHPFHRKSWSPSLDTCTLQGLSLSFLPFHGPPHGCVNSSPVSAALTRLWLACTASYSSVCLSAPGSTVPHTHTHARQVYSKLSGVWHGRAPPACRCAPPSPCVDLCCIHSPIPWKRDWASCTKLFEILFHGKVINSALFRSITVWKSPSRASYGGCPFRAHGLILTYYMIETLVLLFWVQITSGISFMLQTVMLQLDNCYFTVWSIKTTI